VAPANVSVTVFRLGPEWLAFDTRLLQEVTEQRPMHSVPHRRMGVVLGLVNVRGELLLCVSLARLLAVEQDLPRERLRKEYRRLVVVETDARRIAFPVDAVEGVHRFSRDEVQPAPATVAHAQRSFTRGVIRWRDHTIGWLDPAAVSFHLNRSLL
jgi:chemotaxis-related protein WspD